MKAAPRQFPLAAPNGRVHISTVTQLPLPAVKAGLSTFFVSPVRVVWTSTAGVKNATGLLAPAVGQALLSQVQEPLVLRAGRRPGGVVLDFGTEIAGSIEVFTPMTDPKATSSIRVRFGESVSEVMADIPDRGAQNDHALRDQLVSLPWLGRATIGQSGFRFVRIDATAAAPDVRITAVRALLSLRDIPHAGSFACSSPRLERIWRTGAWTVHLNMQDYLWDGIKRDRLVWIGDMHPEVAVINAVFGDQEVVRASLDLTRDVTPVSSWMNGISAYSMWWIIIHEDCWMHHGDLAYLRAQKDYLGALLHRLAGFVDAGGCETLDGMRFVDWPTFADPVAVHEGLQGLMTLAMDSGGRLLRALGDVAGARACVAAADRLRRHTPPRSGRKTPAALSLLAGICDPDATAAALARGGPRDLSTFCGFYVLRALGRAGKTATALDFISRYWGGMLDCGATTFWEDFDLAWMKGSGRIDELVPKGKKCVHADFGEHCYVGLRRSLCHGWAGGPTAFLSEHVLGIAPAAPGFTKVRIEPHLGNLRWAEGSYPTPRGPIRVRHDRAADGSVRSRVSLPRGVVRVRD